MGVVALVMTECNGGAHAQPLRTPVYLAQAQCGPTDSTMSCCVKTHPGSPERCGLSEFEAADLLRAVRSASDLAEGDMPEWKQVCLETYVLCKEEEWLGSCYDCFRYCQGQKEWRANKCRRQKGGN